MNYKDNNEIKQLLVQDIIEIVIIVLAILNMYGDELQRKYICTKNLQYAKKANDIFVFILIVSFFIYLYFLKRNYNAYKYSSMEKRNMFEIKFLGSIFFIVGSICLIYFQLTNTSYIGVPEILI